GIADYRRPQCAGGVTMAAISQRPTHPELDVTALVDPWDEESGSELSERGKWIAREKLEAIGYGHVIFLAAHEMQQYVNANNGKWVQPDSAPVEGWSYYDAPDAGVLVDEAGIDFSDEAM